MKKLKLNFKPIFKQFEIESKRKIVSNIIHNYMRIYRGTDFAGFRDYTPNDDSKRIDWNASARANKLIIKELIEERNTNLYFLMDVSESMLCASTNKLKCEYAAEVIASLSFSVLMAGNRVGLLMFSHGINKFLPSQKGNQHYFEILKALSNPKNYGGQINFANLFASIGKVIPKNCTIILLSDCIGIGNKWNKYFRVISKKFEFAALFMIRDPIDNALPDQSGQIILKDTYSKDDLTIDTQMVRKAFSAKSSQIKKRIKKDFSDYGCYTLELVTNKPYEKEILNFFKSKRR